VSFIAANPTIAVPVAIEKAIVSKKSDVA